MLAVFGCVGGIAWAVTYARVYVEIPIQEQMHDTPPMNGSVSTLDDATKQNSLQNESISENSVFGLYSPVSFMEKT